MNEEASPREGESRGRRPTPEGSYRERRPTEGTGRNGRRMGVNAGDVGVRRCHAEAGVLVSGTARPPGLTHCNSKSHSWKEINKDVRRLSTFKCLSL